MFRVGLAGFGFVGRLHFEAFSKLDDVQIVAVSCGRPGPEGVRRYQGPFALVQDTEVDAVVIALPTHLHIPVATAAVSAGKPVLIEKPLALNVDEAKDLAALASTANVPVQIAHVLHHTQQPSELATMLRSPEFGAPVHLAFTRECPAPEWSAWIRDPTLSGGALYDLMIHDIDFVHSIYGMPDQVFADAVESDPGALDHVTVILSYGGSQPFRISITGSWRLPASYPFTARSRCLGTHQVIETVSRSTSAQIDQGGETTTTIFGSQVSTRSYHAEPLDPFINQARSFIDAVKDPSKAPYPGVEKALDVLRIINAAQQSIRTGTSTSLTDIR